MNLVEQGCETKNIKESQIGIELKNNLNLNEQLEGLILNLETRLLPVLNELTLEELCNKKPEQDKIVPLAAEIRALNTKMRININKLENTLNRLEL